MDTPGNPRYPDMPFVAQGWTCEQCAMVFVSTAYPKGTGLYAVDRLVRLWNAHLPLKG